MTQQGFDFSGVELKEQGTEAALQHADKVHMNWSDFALALLESFARGRAPFTAEDFRKHFTGVLPDPPSCNAIGAMFSRAAKAGILQHSGYTLAQRRAARSRVLRVWQAAV